MEMVLAWAITRIITEMAKKLHISATYVSLIIAFVGWAIYFVATNYYGDQRDQVVYFVTGVYGTSQVIYNIIKKFVPEK